MYLIMKCESLHDQYECDACRTPITLTEDWEKWFENEKPQYNFEVYDFRVGGFVLVKDYEVPMESGMALYAWPMEVVGTEEESDIPPIIVKKWKDATRDDPIPQEVYNIPKYDYDGTGNPEISELQNEKIFKVTVRSGGGAGWVDKESKYWWVYGQYYDHNYNSGI